MPLTADREASVGKKKGKPKPQGTLVRASIDFANAVRKAAQFENMSVSDFMDFYLLPVVGKRYRESLLKESERMKDQR